MSKRPKKRPKVRWTSDVENERWEFLIGGMQLRRGMDVEEETEGAYLSWRVESQKKKKKKKKKKKVRCRNAIE